MLSQPFALTDAYDWMGVRLAGSSLRPIGKLNMPSEPIVHGSIRVAGDGVPTILLADHQTAGYLASEEVSLGGTTPTGPSCAAGGCTRP